MKKGKTRFISNLLLCFGMLFAVLAILCIFLPGCINTLTATVFGQTITTETKVLLYGLVFGNPEVIITVTSAGSTSMVFEGGLSYLGLIGFILVAIGLVVTLLSLFFKRQAKLICVLAFLIILIGACLMMAVLTCGSDVAYQGLTSSFTDTYEEFDLGVGTILFFVSGLISSGFVLGSALTR